MALFIGWATTLLTMYLVRCSWLKRDTLEYHSDIFACWTPTSEREDHPPLPGGFLGTLPLLSTFRCLAYLTSASPPRLPLK